MRDLHKSFWMMTFASLCGALVAVSIKALSTNTSIAVIFFFTRLFLLIAALPFILQKRKSIFNIHKWGSMIIMSTLYVAAFYCYFYSLILVPLAISSLLLNSAPLYVPIIAFFILGEQSLKSKSLWITIFISFIGVILILSPFGKSTYSLLGLILALLSGILIAASQVVTKFITKHDTPHHITFFQSMMSIVITLIPAVYIVAHHGKDYLSDLLTLRNTALLVLCGISSWFFQLYRAKAVHYASVSFAMPFGYLGVVFVGTLDVIFWHVIPSVLSIAGMLIVITGVVLSLKINRYDQ